MMAALRYAKKSVKYTDGHGDSNEWCAKCLFFRPPQACRVVIGVIKPEGWCMKYIDKVTRGRPR